MVEAVLDAGANPLVTNANGYAAHTIAHNAGECLLIGVSDNVCVSLLSAEAEFQIYSLRLNILDRTQI